MPETLVPRAVMSVPLGGPEGKAMPAPSPVPALEHAPVPQVSALGVTANETVWPAPATNVCATAGNKPPGYTGRVGYEMFVVALMLIANSDVGNPASNIRQRPVDRTVFHGFDPPSSNDKHQLSFYSKTSASDRTAARAKRYQYHLVWRPNCGRCLGDSATAALSFRVSNRASRSGSILRERAQILPPHQWRCMRLSHNSEIGTRSNRCRSGWRLLFRRVVLRCFYMRSLHWGNTLYISS
jgi:hypothetical protein